MQIVQKFRSKVLTVCVQVYEKVDDIDLMLGGVAEKNVRGGAVGATFACIIGNAVHTGHR